jgi:2-iminobutanoate/2-iminopropanoate deaminase
MTQQRDWESISLGGGIPAPKGAYSPVVRAGDFLYVSGQIPRDPVTGALVGDDVRSQTRQVMDNVRRALEAAGASLADVVSVTAYLASSDLWADFNEEYKTIMSAPYPSRTALGVELRGILVEISVVAFKRRS